MFDIAFTNTGGTVWSCRVPPDLEDGAYATEIHAMNEFGQTAYWTGFLYMCNGVCHVEFHIPKYTVWYSTGFKIELERGCPHRA